MHNSKYFTIVLSFFIHHCFLYLFAIRMTLERGHDTLWVPAQMRIMKLYLKKWEELSQCTGVDIWVGDKWKKFMMWMMRWVCLAYSVVRGNLINQMEAVSPVWKLGCKSLSYWICPPKLRPHPRNQFGCRNWTPLTILLPPSKCSKW